jgi:UDP:flavonoid glycosyltransferase YjiC (YdhE family)
LAPAVRRLLEESAFEKVAREVQQEIAGQPSPARIAERVAGLVTG